MRIFEDLHVDFLGKRKFFYMLSGGLLLLGLINIIFRGLSFGIDFKGGTEIALQFEKPVDISQLRNLIDKLELGEVEIKSFGSDRGILIRTELQEIPKNIYPKILNNLERVVDQKYPGLPRKIVDSTINSIVYQFPGKDTTTAIIDELFKAGFQTGKVSEDITGTHMIVRFGISDWIKVNLKEKLPDNSFQVLKEDKVGPKVGKELKTNSVIAVFLSLLGILVYLAFRFKFIFAFGAVVALFHDVLLTLGLYAILYGLIPGLNLDITITVISAFLTLIGYSVMDTVVVFDRVREYLKIYKTLPMEEAMNRAVNRTMSRTILTGGTTLVSCIVLLIFGGEVLRAFAFTLTFGIITGTYSSVFVASAIVLDYTRKTGRKIEF
ncbi:MAG: protein translocase subunit SecF [Ignavibacteriales bacterium]|nr:protein translocase subunit SecF [Ignavibacteriales bacterium]